MGVLAAEVPLQRCDICCLGCCAVSSWQRLTGALTGCSCVLQIWGDIAAVLHGEQPASNLCVSPDLELTYISALVAVTVAATDGAGGVLLQHILQAAEQH